MTGTRLISGSDATSFRKRSITATESNIASSILTSIICAPLSTCWRATSRAVSKSPLTINLLKRADPATLVRSPIFTKPVTSLMINGSIPLKVQHVSIEGACLGRIPPTRLRIAYTCSGVVPQHPPTILTNPLSANSPIKSAM